MIKFVFFFILAFFLIGILLFISKTTAYLYIVQDSKVLLYYFVGILAFFLVLYTLGTFGHLQFLLKLKMYMKKSNYSFTERILFWNQIDILLTEQHIYLMHKTFTGKIVSFTYNQLNSIRPISRNFLVGLEVSTENDLLFTLIDGTHYRIGYTEKKKEQFLHIKSILLEKNPSIDIKL